MTTSPPARSNVPDAIIARLRERILRGELEPGERLPPERELAKQFGTNRTSLREALRALEAQGLVRARQGDGVRIQNFQSSGDISLLPHYFAAADPLKQIDILMHLLRLRALLMPEVITLAVEHGTDEQLAHLDHLVDNLATAHEQQDIPAMGLAELALYRSIVEASGALTYLWVFNTLEHIVRGFITAQPNVWIFVPDIITMWSGIVGALQGRDRAEVSRRFIKMLEAIEGQVKQLLPLLQGANS